MFSKTFIAALLAGSAAASPIVAARSTSGSFGLVSIRSGTDLQSQAINAFQGGLWIGKEPSSYCPFTEGCPDGKYTSFVAGAETSLSLNTEVPGGQQVYVAKNYAVSYTEPHSANTFGGKLTGFNYTAGVGSTLGSLSYNGDYGFIACASTDVGTYQVFVTPGGEGTGNCTSIAIATASNPSAGPSAWEY
ncbi:e1fc85cf-5ef4-4346-a26b-94f37f8592a4 [Sclerotinia trifoliorum]|uniref:E1fc85cf-5ef4-4346-a26b-94f37f8592a4 n=1 Tax=Sclerotinia trifoliorum TaxID=28548 RepID=A0A8H2W2R5_9HELO|nr:e1fc85cf-5ef4-4346-a26b-94f37f8592a4 [Sclerotinia trifoliorum]